MVFHCQAKTACTGLVQYRQIWPAKGSRRQNVTIFKVVFKIHFRPFWVILVKKKIIKNNGLVLEKKYIIFFRYNGGGGSDRIVTFVTIFFCLMKVSLTLLLKNNTAGLGSFSVLVSCDY